MHVNRTYRKVNQRKKFFFLPKIQWKISICFCSKVFENTEKGSLTWELILEDSRNSPLFITNKTRPATSNILISKKHLLIKP